jgi:glycosyltransferase involved in cell wall biosynthesis
MISIITPTHKERPLLDLTIKSVLSQSFSDFEWIVLDNSKEGYFETKFNEFLINNPKYEIRRQKVKIIHKTYDEVNIGKLKNECVRLTSCKDNEYILLLDHDDFLVDDSLLNIYYYSNKYPQAQFISGDKVQLLYDVDNKLFYPYKFSEISGTPYEKNYNIASGDVILNIDGFQLNLGYQKEYTIRPYICDVYNREGNRFNTDGAIHSHPRCIKKQYLLNPMFQFYEDHSISEDTVQCYMIGKFLQGVYIPNIIYVCVTYNNNTNSSIEPVEYEVKQKYNMMLNNLCNFSFYLNELFPNLPEMHSILNKDELKSILR